MGEVLGSKPVVDDKWQCCLDRREQDVPLGISTLLIEQMKLPVLLKKIRTILRGPLRRIPGGRAPTLVRGVFIDIATAYGKCRLARS